MPLPKKTTLRHKADKLFSEYVRSRGKCDMCHRKNGVQLQTAHIITRGTLKLRYDPDNALCLCAKCHMWAHDNPLMFAEFVKEYKGRVIYRRLIKDADKLEPITIEWYQGKIRELSGRINFDNF